MEHTWKIGILTDGMKLSLRDGVSKAKELGADGIQFYVTRGEAHVDEFTPEKRKEFRKFVEDLGLEISALCGDFDWKRGFMDPEFNKVNVPRVKRCCDLAVDLGTNVVTMHIGHFANDPSDPVYREVLKTSIELAEYAAERDVVLCSETGPTPPDQLLEFMKQCPEKGIGINYDPANLIMAGPYDHIGGVMILKDYIHHTHAKDGVRRHTGGGREVPLGDGSVAFKYYLAALHAAGYDGFITIEREGGDDPVGDMGRAVEFLRETMRNLPEV